MTERDWLTSCNPEAMLNFMEMGRVSTRIIKPETRVPVDESEHFQAFFGSPQIWASERKLRLFTCATCMHPGTPEDENVSRKFIAWVTAWVDEGVQPMNGQRTETWLLDDVWVATRYPLRFMQRHSDPLEVTGVTGYSASFLCRLLREIFGNPWRTPVLTWRWRTPTVISLARRIYDEQTWELLPLLADALDDAGCKETGLQHHCRGLEPCQHCGGTGRENCQVDAGYNNSLMIVPGWRHCYLCNDHDQEATSGWRMPPEALAHVRGCWVLDLILEKF